MSSRPGPARQGVGLGPERLPVQRFLPFPLVCAPEVELRPWERRDAEVLVDGWRDPDVAHFCGVPDTPTRLTAHRWVDDSVDRRRRGLAVDSAIVPAGADHPVGDIGLFRFTREPARAEIGWWLVPAGRGRGLAAAAAKAMIDWAGAELGLVQVYARVDPANAPGARTAEAAGLRRLGRDSDGMDLWAVALGSGRCEPTAMVDA